MKTLIGKTAQELRELGKQKHQAYMGAQPFPHTYFDNFFPTELLDRVLKEFPALQKEAPVQFANKYENKKAATLVEDQFGPATREFAHFLNSQPFLDFLSELTGIQNLIADAYFDGGGFHEIQPGGWLKIHADFNKHHYNNLDRRINVLVYLNKNWKEEYGGHFELWDKEMKKSQAKILPLFNRMAIFSTNDFTYHGHPEPLACPPGMSRKSLALYYYTNGRPVEEINKGIENHNTLFQARPVGDEAVKREVDLTTTKDVIKAFIPPILLDGFRWIKRKIKNK